MGGALDPTVAKARNAVASVLADLDQTARVVVAVSGGADSLALAAATAFVTVKRGLALSAVIVDHQLQAGSAEVAATAAKQLSEMGIRTEIVVVTVGTEGGMEAAARTCRHEVFGALHADAVLLGHTLDDQAETVLLGLGRGSGARSLAGMAAVDGLLRRPFLRLTRRDTEQVCRASGLHWWNDPHNNDPSFTRVRLRHEALPLLEEILGGGVAKALARTAELLRDDNTALDFEASQHSGQLEVRMLAKLPAAIRSRVLRSAALAAGADGSELAAHHIRGMDRLVTDWRGQQRIELPGGVAASRAGDSVVFVPTPVGR